MLLILLTALCVFICEKVEGNDKVIVDDMLLVFVSDEYFSNETCTAGVIVDGSETKGYLHLNITQPIPCEAVADFHVWQYMNGEYDKPTGIDYQQPFEKVLDDVTMVGPVVKELNMKECPIAPGYYAIDNYVLKDDNYPNKIPSGQFNGVTTITWNEKLLLELDSYFHSDE